jgi:hypothetical protein
MFKKYVRRKKTKNEYFFLHSISLARKCGCQLKSLFQPEKGHFLEPILTFFLNFGRTNILAEKEKSEKMKCKGEADLLYKYVYVFIYIYP